MVALEFKNVSYSYEGEEEQIPALKHASFCVNEGEFVVILGGNGSGKSTLSKLVGGLLIPDDGEVLVFGESTDKKEKDLFKVRSKVGMVFQNPDNQMVASIIEDDVAFGPENLGVPRDEIEERVTWALNAVGMSDYRKHTPTKLSGGQKQRVAMAGVLAMKPKILVLDESTAMLDPQGRLEVLNTVKELNKNEGMTVLHITHHMEECIDADRALVLKEGELIFDGTPDSLFSNFKLVESSFLELPPLTKIIYLLKQKNIHVPSDIHDEKELAKAIWQLKSEI